MRWQNILINLVLLPMVIAAQQPKIIDTTLTIYFNTGKITLDRTEEINLLSTLNKISDSLHIREVSGYTDSVGSRQSNLELSRLRSQYIANFLRRYFILDMSKITSYGEQNPVSLTENALNRRVVISLRIFGKLAAFSDTMKFQIIRRFKLEHLYFRPDEPILEPNSMPYLASVANILKLDTMDLFEITGHVNWNSHLSASADSGYETKMNKLSADRAKLVYDILADLGIPHQRMFWKGMGNTEMIYPDASTDEEKRKNMRVEILVLRRPN